MLYDVGLTITYDYAASADAGRHLVRLMPADLQGEQRAIAGTLSVEPRPQEWIDRIDFFGNRFTELLFDEPHEEIVFKVQARVDRLGPGSQFDISPPLSMLAQEIAAYRGIDPWSPHHFTGSTLRAPIEHSTADFAKNVVQAGASTFETVSAINSALHRDMTAYAREVTAGAATTFSAVSAVNSALNRYMEFDPEATTVETSPEDAFERRRGVCQDFTHIMIACLRGIGIPAGYVSGYLRTIPPPGAEKLEGADAMHAWVRAWCGHETGWVEFDPTNAMLAGSDHVVVAYGRDYADVAPVKGSLRSAGPHETRHFVDVVPVDPA